MERSNVRPSDELSPQEREYENSIRPQTIEDFAGQPQLIENLRIFIKAANMRGEALDHVLFHGPPGLGKTTLSRIVANELGVKNKRDQRASYRKTSRSRRPPHQPRTPRCIVH